MIEDFAKLIICPETVSFCLRMEAKTWQLAESDRQENIVSSAKKGG